MYQKNNILKTVGELVLLCLIVISCRYQHQADNEGLTTINDSAIYNAIVKEFEVQPAVSAKNLGLRVENGIVTLSGSVENLLEKDEAAEISSMVRGVKGVINLMDVQTEPVSDHDLRARITDLFYEDPALESYMIRVEADSGLINLYGRVNAWTQKQLAADLVKTVSGVRKINNELAFRFTSDRPKFDLKRDITSALRNDIRVDDGLIEVEIQDSIAILKGTVGSAAEKSLAIVHAHIPGIDSVNARALIVSAEERDPLMRKDKYVEKQDDEIVAAIQQAFLQDPRLFNHDVKLICSNGHVTLSGTVNNMRAKRAAGEDVSNIVGVWSVENNINVEPMALPTDNVVADQVRSHITSHPYLDRYSITVDWKPDGTVLLNGKVDYSFEKDAAEAVASRTMGVIDIKNNIEVARGIELPYTISPGLQDLPELKTPRILSDEQLKENIAEQLWWSPFVDRNQIELEVNEGWVTLNGTVNTATEMDYAVKNAYEGGAVKVINNLKVDFWEL